MRLPKGELAIVDDRKVIDYLLSSTHPIGRHKAQVFKSALGLTAEGAVFFKDELRRAAIEGEAEITGEDAYGVRFRIDFQLTLNSKTAVIRSAWLSSAKDQPPVFLTAFVV
jgi:hypothetical protein